MYVYIFTVFVWQQCYNVILRCLGFLWFRFKFLYLVQFIWTRGAIPYLFVTLNTCLIFVYFLNKSFLTLKNITNWEPMNCIAAFAFELYSMVEIYIFFFLGAYSRLWYTLEVCGLQFKLGGNALISFSFQLWIRWDVWRWNCDGRQIRMEKEL